jgi:hypothetical protein
MWLEWQTFIVTWPDRIRNNDLNVKIPEEVLKTKTAGA